MKGFEKEDEKQGKENKLQLTFMHSLFDERDNGCCIAFVSAEPLKVNIEGLSCCWAEVDSRETPLNTNLSNL